MTAGVKVYRIERRSAMTLRRCCCFSPVTMPDGQSFRGPDLTACTSRLWYPPDLTELFHGDKEKAMQLDKFTLKSQEAIQAAQGIAQNSHNQELQPEHLVDLKI